MKQLCVTIRVSPAAAVRAGKSVLGDVTLTLSNNDLQSLSEAQRECLAKHVGGEWPWNEPLRDVEVGEASLESLKILLDARIAREAKQKEERDAAALAEEARRADVIAKLKQFPDDQFLVPPSSSWGQWALRSANEMVPGCGLNEVAAWMIGRREAIEALLQERNAALKAEREAAEKQEKLKRLLEEQKAAQKERLERETTIAFLEKHAGRDAVEWFEQLEAPKQAYLEVTKCLERLLDEASESLKQPDPEVTFYRLAVDSRVGPVIDNVTDLAQYRRLQDVTTYVYDAVRHLGLDADAVFIQPIIVYRPAEGDEEGDEDGEVACPTWIQVTYVCGVMTARLYTC